MVGNVREDYRISFGVENQGSDLFKSVKDCYIRPKGLLLGVKIVCHLRKTPVSFHPFYNIWNPPSPSGYTCHRFAV